MTRLATALCAVVLSVSACASADGIHGTARADAAGAAGEILNWPSVDALAAARAAKVAEVIVGQASWYGSKFQGRPTASGEPFDMHRLTAAHRTLPFGTKVRVVNQANGRSVVVRVNDRGPFAGHRVIDLSRAAAERIGLRNAGVGRVRLEVLGES